MPLGQAYPVFIAHQIAVIKLRWPQAEGTIQKYLPCRRLQEIGAADNFRDPHLGIVDHDSELICGNIIATPDDEVAEVAPRNETLWTQMRVGKADFFAVGHAESPVCTCGRRRWSGMRLVARDWPAGSRIDRFIIQIIGRAHCLGNFPAGTSTGIDQSALMQILPGGQIACSPLALRIRGMRTAAIRAFVPGDTEPAQIFEHGIDELSAATLRIQVFVAQDQSSAMLSRPLRGNPECARVSEMQQAGWRGRKPATIRTGVSCCRKIAHRPFYRLACASASRAALGVSCAGVIWIIDLLPT